MSSSGHSGQSVARTLARAIAVAIAYLLLARLGLSTLVEPGGIAAFWPPSGLLLAALLLSPRSSWLWTLAAVAVANVISNLLAGRPVGLSVAYAVVSCSEAYLGAWAFVRSCGERTDLSSLKQVIGFLLLAVLIPYTIGGVLASIVTTLYHPHVSFWATGPVWLVSGGMGAAMVAPLLLTWLSPSPDRYTTPRVVEAVALLVLLAFVCSFVFGETSGGADFPLFYLTLPITIMAAVRFGPRGAATATLVVFAFALGHIVQRAGPFAADPAQSVQWIQIYSLVIVVSSLVVAATWLERGRALGSLAESEQMVTLALDGAYMGAWSWNIGTDEVTWSDSVAGMFGLHPGQFGGRYEDFLALVHDDDRDIVAEGVALVLGGERDDYHHEHRIVWPDGTERWVESRGRVYRDALARPVRMAGTVVDTTERRRARERERQLEARLQNAQKLESVGLLAGGIAHDFNNLLQVILLSGSVLEETLEDSPELPVLRDILDAGQQAADLTKSLLAFTRRHVGVSEHIDANEVVERTLEMLRRLIPESIEVSFAPSSGLPIVSVPRSEIEQAVVNLCLNARDAMPDGGRLTLSTAVVTLGVDAYADLAGVEPSEFVELAVTDTGVGIDAAQQARIFEPFFTTREVGQGTGLGLFVVHAFVTRMGGRVEVESELGRGTTVRLLLPASRPIDAHGPRDSTARPSSGAAHRVLVVEDNELVRKAVTQALEAAGHVVVTATDGADALRVFERADRFDLVLIDAVMPKMSGREVYDAISPTHPELPFLFTSGYAAGTLSEEFFAHPRRHLIAKPYQAQELLVAISELLDSE